jgi:hypothetical protein
MRTIRTRLFIAGFVGSLVIRPVFASESVECDELLDALRTLTTGTFDERWTLLDEELPHAQHLADDDALLARCRELALHKIFLILRGEPDERLVCRLMERLDWNDDGPLHAYIRKALSDPSPNVRQRAAGAAASMPSDDLTVELRRLWKRESRPWVRSTIAVALGNARDDSQLKAFNTLIEQGDPIEGFGALSAVQSLRSSQSVPALKVAAGSPESVLQHFALSALLDWYDVPGTAQAIVELAVSSNEELATSVISAITTRRKDALVLLDRIQTRSDAEHHSAASKAASEAIERLTHPERFQTITLNCGSTVSAERGLPLVSRPEGDAWDFGRFETRAQNGDVSVRCYDAPGYANHDHISPRVRTGEGLLTFDVFEWDGETWYAAFGPATACWLPASRLFASDEDSDDSDDDEHASAIEFDLRIEELASEAVRRAIQSGYATLFDDDRNVTGVRLDAPGADRDRMLGILDTRDMADGEFGRAIDAWLVKNAGAWISDPELGSRIQAAERRAEP